MVRTPQSSARTGLRVLELEDSDLVSTGLDLYMYLYR